MFTSITIVTVAHESAGIIRRALTALPPGCEIICVDNASTDDIDGALEGLNAIRIRNEENIGYGKACNQGAKAATGTFVLFMNPDVVLAPGAIGALLTAALRYPEASVFFPRIVDQNDHLWFRDVSRLHPGRGKSSRPDALVAGDCCANFVEGSVFMIRRSLFHRIGGFDENIFLYFEDDDLSFRLRAIQEPVVYVDDARAVHYVGSSTPATMSYVFARNWHKKRSEFHLRAKYRFSYNRSLDLAHHFGKVLFYLVTFNRVRLVGAAGRLRGIWDQKRGAHRQVSRPRVISPVCTRNLSWTVVGKQSRTFPSRTGTKSLLMRED